MAMSRSTSVCSIVTGCIILGFAVIALICGAISASKTSAEFAASAGICSPYYGVPGILTIVAGKTKRGVVMGFALFFNIIAVIISLSNSFGLISFTIMLNDVKENRVCVNVGNTCTCTHSGGPDEGGTALRDMNCDDLDTIHSVAIVSLVVFIILTITTFTASIFGCLGTCCAPKDPVVVVTAGVPLQAAGSTVVVASNQSSSFQDGDPGGMPTAYGYGQPEPQMYGDKKGLVTNTVI